MATIQQALLTLRPGAEWVLHGDTYAGLEWLDAVQTKPTEQEIVDEIAALDAAATAEATREADIRGDAGRVDLLNRLKTASPSQIDTWVDNNVTNIATARTVLKAIIKVIALDARD
jgi:hypothetical protein